MVAGYMDSDTKDLGSGSIRPFPAATGRWLARTLVNVSSTLELKKYEELATRLTWGRTKSGSSGPRADGIAVIYEDHVHPFTRDPVTIHRSTRSILPLMCWSTRSPSGWCGLTTCDPATLQHRNAPENASVFANTAATAPKHMAASAG